MHCYNSLLHYALKRVTGLHEIWCIAKYHPGYTEVFDAMFEGKNCDQTCFVCGRKTGTTFLYGMAPVGLCFADAMQLLFMSGWNIPGDRIFRDGIEIWDTSLWSKINLVLLHYSCQNVFILGWSFTSLLINELIASKNHHTISN